MKIACLSVALFASALFGAERPENVAALFHSPENLSAVASPDRVELCILYVKDPWFSKDLRKRKYKEGKSITLSLEAAALISSKLTDERTYGWDYVKPCWPTYNARFRFYRGGVAVSADLCFGCGILLLARDGQPFDGEDFDAASDEIFEIVRTVFPNDRVVREIIEHRKRQSEIAEQARLATELEEKKKANQSVETTPVSAPH